MATTSDATDRILTLRLALLTDEVTDDDLLSAFLGHAFGGTARNLVESLRAAITEKRPWVALSIATAELSIVHFAFIMFSRLTDREVESAYDQLSGRLVPPTERHRLLTMMAAIRPRLAARLAARIEAR